MESDDKTTIYSTGEKLSGRQNIQDFLLNCHTEIDNKKTGTISCP